MKNPEQCRSIPEFGPERSPSVPSIFEENVSRYTERAEYLRKQLDYLKKDYPKARKLLEDIEQKIYQFEMSNRQLAQLQKEIHTHTELPRRTPEAESELRNRFFNISNQQEQAADELAKTLIDFPSSSQQYP